eukprot:s1139_g20.t1
MSIKLRELIRSIRACKTAAEERAVIARECALIRTAFKEDDNQFRHRNVAKLLFIHMMGYPTHFGQMECLKLIASSKFPEKRVGYLGLTQLLDENTEVLMLVTNSIKNDMSNDNQYVTGLALCALGNIGSNEMCRALAREVEQMMTSSNPYLRKKAALCAMRIVRKVEEIEDKFNGKIGNLLEDRNHGVLLAGCSLLTALLEVNPSYVRDFRRYIPSLVRALRNLVTSGYSNAAEYDIAGITDPFLQAKILRLLRILGENSVDASDEMNDILAQVATNTEGTKNTGNAMLYECVLTIMSIKAESGLRVLGINILGRFLLSRDNNIRYVALATLQRVVNVDQQVMQRHRNTIIDCLKDADISIRKRALDVTYSLVDESNIKSMTKELLNYLLVAEPDFKEELCSRVCLAVEKFSPNRRWQIDTLIKVMCLGGNFVKEQQREKFCRVVAATPELHSYTVIKLYFNMKESLTQEALVHVGVWCLGEFGDHLVSGRAVGPDNQPIRVTPGDVLDLLHDVVRKPPTGEKASATHCLVAAALIKLVTRCPSEFDRIKKLLRRFDTSLHVDLQQRSCEFLELLSSEWDSHRAGILDRMPVPEREIGGAESRDVGDSSIDEVPSGGGARAPPAGGKDLLDLNDLLDAPASQPSGPAPVAPASVGGGGGGGGAGDLLDLLDGGGGGAAAPAPGPGGGGDLGLLDIFGGESEPAPPVAAQEAPPMVAFEKNGLKVTFFPRKEANGSSTILAKFSNSLNVPMTNFNFEAAVPKYCTLNIQAATGQVLPPQTDLVTQTMNCVNSSNGEKGLIMKLRIGYVCNGTPVQEMGAVALLYTFWHSEDRVQLAGAPCHQRKRLHHRQADLGFQHSPSRTDRQSVILSEAQLNTAFQAPIMAVQTAPAEIMIYHTEKQMQIGLSSPFRVKGVSVGGSTILLWNSKQIMLYDIDVTMQASVLSQFTRSYDIVAAALFCQSHDRVVAMASGAKIEFANKQGHVEGFPTCLDVCGDFLVASTSLNFIKVWKVSQDKPKPIGAPRKFEGLEERSLGEIRSVRINKTGTRVSMLVDQRLGANGQPTEGGALRVPDGRMFVYDTDSDNFLTHLSWALLGKVLQTGRRLSSLTWPMFLLLVHMAHPTNEWTCRTASLLRYTVGKSSVPVAHFWDASDGRLLCCEVVPQALAYDGEDRFKSPCRCNDAVVASLQAQPPSPTAGGMEDEAKNQPQHCAMTLFVANSEQIHLQDSIPCVDPDHSVTQMPVALMVPHEPAASLVSRTVLRDFAGLENMDEETTAAMLNFSYHLACGNTDEAYKSVKGVRSTGVWESMSKMCVKTGRLDVAQKCLGQMGHARAAGALRACLEQEPEARLAIVAVHLDMVDHAEQLLKKCGRYDLLNQLWEKALEIAKTKDRDSNQKAVEDVQGALTHYELSGTYRTESPRLLCSMGMTEDLGSYVEQSDDSQLHRWYAQYLESKADLDGASREYKKAGDWLSLCRVACFNEDLESAQRICEDSQD